MRFLFVSELLTSTRFVLGKTSRLWNHFRNQFYALATLMHKDQICCKNLTFIFCCLTKSIAVNLSKKIKYRLMITICWFFLAVYVYFRLKHPFGTCKICRSSFPLWATENNFTKINIEGFVSCDCFILTNWFSIFKLWKKKIIRLIINKLYAFFARGYSFWLWFWYLNLIHKSFKLT